jgi:hypothetical protein
MEQLTQLGRRCILDETSVNPPRTLHADPETLRRQLEELDARVREENRFGKGNSAERNEPPIFVAGK